MFDFARAIAPRALWPAAAALTLALAACVPMQVYHKTGTPLRTVERDALDCEAAALAKAPVTLQTRIIPGYYTPGRRICNAEGCRSTPGYFVPPQTETYDANAGFRARWQNACMQDKGYEIVKLNRCTASGTVTLPARQPALSEKSCVIKSGEQWLIVTP